MKVAQWKCLIVLIVFPISLMAQPGNPGNGPIGGVLYLLIAGVGVGIISLRRRRRQ